MSSFLPWSKRSQGWEPHARELRRMPKGVSIDEYDFDPLILVPFVGLYVAEQKQYMLCEASADWSGACLIQVTPSVGTKSLLWRRFVTAILAINQLPWLHTTTLGFGTIRKQ